jgi:hypothetical protein
MWKFSWLFAGNQPERDHRPEASDHARSRRKDHDAHVLRRELCRAAGSRGRRRIADRRFAWKRAARAWHDAARDAGDIAYHTAAVARGNKNALVVADMPFGTVGSREETYANAVQLMRAGAQMVKIEGGEWVADTVKFLVDRSIPVCGMSG